MSLKSFLNLVEIQTKIASLFPFLIGVLFVAWRYEGIKIQNTVVFFCSMLIFDLTTTAINNYMDYRKATDNHEFDYRKECNVIGQDNLAESLVMTVILAMLAIATGLGIYLVYLTDFLILLIGIMCFFIGIFYTFGPIPLSRLPLGEVFSGVTMGLGIIFLTIYVNVYDLGVVNLDWINPNLVLEVNLHELLIIGLVAVPSMLTIANLMMANNICDLEEDIRNNRFTLPYYIGKAEAVILFEWLYYIAFFMIVVAVMLQVYAPIMLLSTVALIPVYKNIKIFKAKQKKSETFIVAVKNLVLTNGAIVIALILSLILF